MYFKFKLNDKKNLQDEVGLTISGGVVFNVSIFNADRLGSSMNFSGESSPLSSLSQLASSIFTELDLSRLWSIKSDAALLLIFRDIDGCCSVNLRFLLFCISAKTLSPGIITLSTKFDVVNRELFSFLQL